MNVKKSKKIRNFVGRLPSIGLLKISYTFDLTFYFFCCRIKAQIFAACLATRFSRAPGDPILSAYQNGKLDKWTYEAVWLLVDFYEIFYTLIAQAWPYLQPELSQILEAPNSPFSLLLEILREEYDEDFLAAYRGEKFSLVKKAEERCRLLRKYHHSEAWRGEVGVRRWMIDGEDLHHLKQGSSNSKWLRGFTWQVINEASKENPVIAGQIRNFHQVAAKLADHQLRFYYHARHNHTSETRLKLRSTKWINGKLYEGVKGGGYRRTLDLDRFI